MNLVAKEIEENIQKWMRKKLITKPISVYILCSYQMGKEILCYKNETLFHFHLTD